MTWAQNHVYADPWSLWTDTIAKNPNAWGAYNNLGVLERDANMLSEAEADFRHSLEVKPDNVEAVMNLGILQQKRLDLDGAIALLKQAAEIADRDPIHGAGYARVYTHLGQAFKAKGDSKAALAAFYQAVQMDHHDLDAINGIGVIYYERGKLDAARKWYEDAIKIDPLYLRAHTNLGNLLMAQGDLTSALAEWKLVLDSNRNDVAAINSMGMACVQLGQWDLAVRYFKRALEIDPEFDQAQRNLVAAIRHQQAAATQAATQRATTTQAAGK
jgi:tetratricopeptide (TPR) repeat protein